MGISLTICIPSLSSCIRRAATVNQEKVLRIVKMDGKILEFKTPALVKDIFMNVSVSGIRLSRETSDHLPLNYQLKIGKVYYILPSKAATNRASAAATTDGGVKRHKFMITKQQLEQLLSKKTSVGEVLSMLERKATWSIDSPTDWKPTLESFPEGTE